MSGRRTNLGLVLLALVPIACCIGVPLIAAAGVSVAVAAWVGGVAAAATVVLVAVVIMLVLRLRRSGRLLPPLSITRSRS